MDVALFGSIADLKELDPNRSTPGGTTVLMLVASDFDRVELLLGRGARVNYRSRSGFSPLIVACSYGGNADVVRLLLEHGAKISPPPGVKVLFDRSPLMQAVISGDTKQISLLVECGSDVRRKSVEIAQFAKGRAQKTPEIMQALEGHQMSDHHRQMIRYSVKHLEFVDEQIGEPDLAIAKKIKEAGLQQQWELLQTLPGARARCRRLAETSFSRVAAPRISGNLSNCLADVKPTD